MRLSPAVKALTLCSVFALMVTSAQTSMAATSSSKNNNNYSTNNNNNNQSAAAASLQAAQNTAIGQSLQQSNDAAQQAVLQALAQQQNAQQQMQQQQTQPWMQPGQQAGQSGTLNQLLNPEKPVVTQSQLNEQLKDRDSAAYKADQLAKKAKNDMATMKYIDDKAVDDVQIFDENPPPPEIEVLQNIAITNKTDSGFADDLISNEAALDMRRDSMREAALSYGARGGLAKRAYQIMERLNDFSPSLDRVFDFRQLLIKAPSGMMIEPPIVKESLRSTIINDDGVEAAVADQVLKINKQAKIVTGPRDWRQYLVMTYASEIPPPPRVLWPKTKIEQADWDEWIRQGWEAGYAQGDDIFDMNVNQMTADYNGMVRYRMLLAEGKISQPFAMQEDRGVTGGGNEMRVGDRALRITGPSEFLTGADLWKPASR